MDEPNFKTLTRIYREFLDQRNYQIEGYHSYMQKTSDINFKQSAVENSEFQYSMFGLKFKVVCELDPNFKFAYLITYSIFIEKDGKLTVKEAARTKFDKKGYSEEEENFYPTHLAATVNFIHNLEDRNLPLTV